jgi:FAD:protein FMN transferase
MQLFRFEFHAMGCPCELQLFAETADAAQRCAQQVIRDLHKLEARYSRYRADSELSRINRAASQGAALTVDEETAGLLNYAQTCYQLSDGLFDISSGLLRQIWDFTRLTQLPTQAEIDRLLQRIGWDKITWQAPLLSFGVAGMELDLGGIVKEYAADRAAQLCRDSGVLSGVVNLGGDVRIIGPRPDGALWRIGLSHPLASEHLRVSLAEGAIASSGDYQRFVMIDGERYSHILNPLSGWPVRYLSAVSVVGDLCVVAGSAATIAMLKEQQGLQWLQQMGLPYFWVDAQGRQGGSLLKMLGEE